MKLIKKMKESLGNEEQTSINIEYLKTNFNNKKWNKIVLGFNHNRKSFIEIMTVTMSISSNTITLKNSTAELYFSISEIQRITKEIMDGLDVISLYADNNEFEVYCYRSLN